MIRRSCWRVEIQSMPISKNLFIFRLKMMLMLIFRPQSLLSVLLTNIRYGWCWWSSCPSWSQLQWKWWYWGHSSDLSTCISSRSPLENCYSTDWGKGHIARTQSANFRRVSKRGGVSLPIQKFLFQVFCPDWFFCHDSKPWKSFEKNCNITFQIQGKRGSAQFGNLPKICRIWSLSVSLFLQTRSWFSVFLCLCSVNLLILSFLWKPCTFLLAIILNLFNNARFALISYPTPTTW